MTVRFGQVIRINPVYDQLSRQLTAQVKLPGFQSEVEVAVRPDSDRPGIVEAAVPFIRRDNHPKLQDITVSMAGDQAGFVSRLLTGTLLQPVSVKMHEGIDLLQGKPAKPNSTIRSHYRLVPAKGRQYKELIRELKRDALVLKEAWEKFQNPSASHEGLALEK